MLLQVKMECSKNTISPYTPISTFFVNGDNMAAFFIGCTATADGENTGLTVRSTNKTLILLEKKVQIVRNKCKTYVYIS